LCAFRLDLEKRTVASLDFLKDHPKGIAGISRAQLLTSVTNQQRTIITLQGLDCDKDTPVELLVIPAENQPPSTPKSKARSQRRKRSAKQLASAGIQPSGVLRTARATPEPNQDQGSPQTGIEGPRGPQGEQGDPGTPTPEQPDKGTPSTPAPSSPAPTTPSVPKPPPVPETPPTPAPSGPIRSTVCGVLELIQVTC
jgi:hypothetical protein